MENSFDIDTCSPDIRLWVRNGDEYSPNDHEHKSTMSPYLGFLAGH